MGCEMIDIEKTIFESYPELKGKLGQGTLLNLIKRLTHEGQINAFLAQNQHLRGFALLDKCLAHFNFSYQVSNQCYARVPSEGRVLIVANHPIGSLDGLALLAFVRSIRADVRVVANSLLSEIEPLKSLFISVDNLAKKTSHHGYFKQAVTALCNEEAVIIFPAGEVSRLTPKGIKDGEWQTSFLRLAKKTKSPILPVYIDARNSALFYGLSTLYKPLGTLMLVNEMFNKVDQKITLHVGALTPWKSIASVDVPMAQWAKYFRKHIYQLTDFKKAVPKFEFKTQQTILHPVNRKALKRELEKSNLLGNTADGKQIYLFDYVSDSAVMQEIGRLRELTFRTVEEGTGTPVDLDVYDTYYRHLVLWDDKDLEIVGAYRIGVCQKIEKQYGMAGLYSNSLFELKSEMQPLLANALELGRSFVQPRYWGTRSLDYLWYGIGAYIKQHPEVNYLFGPVSLSDAYSNQAKEWIVSFYKKQMGSNQDLAVARTPFVVSHAIEMMAGQLFKDAYKASFEKLTLLLSQEGLKLPTLFKQYAELCEPGGCRFVDFSLDRNFSNCIDGLVFVEVDKIVAKKRKRYLSAD